jgi:hypothetical protein
MTGNMRTRGWGSECRSGSESRCAPLPGSGFDAKTFVGGDGSDRWRGSGVGAASCCYLCYRLCCVTDRVSIARSALTHLGLLGNYSACLRGLAVQSSSKIMAFVPASDGTLSEEAAGPETVHRRSSYTLQKSNLSINLSATNSVSTST